jgi:hypothetical protein
MAGKKESTTQWRQTSVVIRADILDRALLQKIDISESCNQAIAERLGIDYRQQKIPEGIVTEPVIIAANGKPVLPDHASPKPAAPVPAIINADDPHAVKKVKSRHLPGETSARDVPPTAPLPVSASETETPLSLSQPPATGKGKRPFPPRKKKDAPIKKFFTSMILREDSDTALIGKDDMYYTFERWCRDHRMLPVPDRKSFQVTLKNQFAVKEKILNGTPMWIGVRVK